MRTQSLIDDFVNARPYQTVGRNNQPSHSVVANEQTDDFRSVVTQSRLAAGQPQIRNWRHRARDLFDLRKGHVAGTIQLFVIETSATETVAARSDEQNYCAETLFTFRRTKK